MASIVVSDVVSVANNAYMTIQPDAGYEFIIHDIDTAGVACTLYRTDGTNDVAIDVTGSWTNLNLGATNTRYIRVKNTSGGTVYMGYGGFKNTV
jgi:hypothetical protein